MNEMILSPKKGEAWGMEVPVCVHMCTCVLVRMRVRVRVRRPRANTRAGRAHQYRVRVRLNPVAAWLTTATGFLSANQRGVRIPTTVSKA